VPYTVKRAGAPFRPTVLGNVKVAVPDWPAVILPSVCGNGVPGVRSIQPMVNRAFWASVPPVLVSVRLTTIWPLALRDRLLYTTIRAGDEGTTLICTLLVAVV